MSVDKFIQSLISLGWKVELKDNPSFTSTVLQTRYRSIPDSYKEFLSKVAYCRNSDNGVWFLCEDDFEGKSDSAFAWNDFELQSLESAEGDEKLSAQIKDFWEHTIPILISVKGYYSYLAIEVGEGNIVQGNEPAYEEVVKICISFVEFMEIIAKNPPLLTRELLPFIS